MGLKNTPMRTEQVDPWGGEVLLISGVVKIIASLCAEVHNSLFSTPIPVADTLQSRLYVHRCRQHFPRLPLKSLLSPRRPAVNEVERLQWGLLERSERLENENKMNK
jgi:hypothetical protein